MALAIVVSWPASARAQFPELVTAISQADEAALADLAASAVPAHGMIKGYRVLAFDAATIEIPDCVPRDVEDTTTEQRLTFRSLEGDLFYLVNRAIRRSGQSIFWAARVEDHNATEIGIARLWVGPGQRLKGSVQIYAGRSFVLISLTATGAVLVYEADIEAMDRRSETFEATRRHRTPEERLANMERLRVKRLALEADPEYQREVAEVKAMQARRADEVATIEAERDAACALAGRAAPKWD